MHSFLVLFLAAAVIAAIASAQSRTFTPVTQAMLENPSPDDWLMYSRTYDAQRFSPLKQIDRQSVGPASKGLVEGTRRDQSSEHSDCL
jgi:glucose dehydrogenase